MAVFHQGRTKFHAWFMFVFDAVMKVHRDVVEIKMAECTHEYLGVMGQNVNVLTGVRARDFIARVSPVSIMSSFHQGIFQRLQHNIFWWAGVNSFCQSPYHSPFGNCSDLAPLDCSQVYLTRFFSGNLKSSSWWQMDLNNFLENQKQTRKFGRTHWI